MGIKVQRATHRQGASRSLSLLVSWCRYYGQRVDRVTIVGDCLLIVAPEGFEDEATKVAEGIEQRLMPNGVKEET